MCKRIWLFLLSSILCCNVYASSPEPPKNINNGDTKAVTKYLDKLINYWLEEDELISLSIAIVSDNDIVWQKAYGLKDIDTEIPVTQESVYRIGAVSGVLTAALVMRLVELGKLNLEDSIDKYIPELKFKYHDNKKYQINIKNLLTHHAGLPLSRFSGSWSVPAKDFRDLPALLNQSYASYPPATVYAYSNLGYSLLALVVERATRISFEQALGQYILKPLGMAHTHVRLTNEIKTQLTTEYRKGEEIDRLFPRDIASIGLFSNVGDLSKFLRMLIFEGDVPVLSKSSIRSMLSQQNEDITLDLEKQIGFGVNIGGMDVSNAGNVIWRSGATLGHRARVAILSEHKLGVVVLSNDSRAWDAITEIAERSLQTMLQMKTGIKPVDEKKKLESTKVIGSISPLPDSYSSFLGFIPIEKNDGTISAKLLGWPLRVQAAERGWYTLEYDLFGIIPIDVSWIADLKVRPARINKHQVLIAHFKNKQFLIGDHVSFNPIHSAWKKRIGDYRIINHDALLKNMEISQGKLIQQEGKLFFIYEVPDWFGMELQVPLNTLSDDMAIIPGLGTALNETIQIKRFGIKEYIGYSGYLLERIKEDDSLWGMF